MRDCEYFKASNEDVRDNEPKRGRGRPRKENSNCEYFGMRMTQEELNMLGEIADREGLSKSEFLRGIIRGYFTYTKAVKKYDK